MHTTHLYYIIYNWAREGAELAGEHLNLCRHLPVALTKGVVWNNSNHTEIDTPRTNPPGPFKEAPFWQAGMGSERQYLLPGKLGHDHSIADLQNFLIGQYGNRDFHKGTTTPVLHLCTIIRLCSSVAVAS